MNCHHSRSLVVLLASIVLACGLPAMPGGGLLHPALVCADQGIVVEYSVDADDREDGRDENAYYQDLNQLDDARDRELDALQEEYDRDLGEIEADFRRDLTEEGDPVIAGESYRERRDELESRFEEQRRQLTQWYEEKAAEIEGR